MNGTPISSSYDLRTFFSLKPRSAASVEKMAMMMPLRFFTEPKFV